MNKSSVIALLALLGLAGCESTCGAMKRLMYETPGRDRWQRPDEVVAALAIEPGATVADLGSGGGYFTYRLAEAVGPTGRVYAVDVDTSLLAYVERQAKKRSLSWIETVHAPEDGLGLPDASVDLIFLANVFHHLPDPKAYFRGARSVLRREGRIAVVERSGGGFPSGHATPPDAIRAALESAGYERIEDHAFLEHQSFQVFRLRPGTAAR
jgi:ubiquinone/menaquinone biosynthesis C-methylase UbiE